MPMPLMTTHIHSISEQSKPKLQAQGLTCIRGDRQLFDGLGFELSAGDCLHVRGANGVGKTSLLRLLTGLSKPESGTILWNGQAISAQETAYHRNLLFLGHREALKEELSALENLQMYAAIDDVTLPQESALRALSRFGLRGRENLPVHCLSAGQKRRVLMARMLTRSASLWILDEPFNALDIHAMGELENLIGEHLETGGLLIFTSHQSIQLERVKVLNL